MTDTGHCNVKPGCSDARRVLIDADCYRATRSAAFVAEKQGQHFAFSGIQCVGCGRTRSDLANTPRFEIAFASGER